MSTPAGDELALAIGLARELLHGSGALRVNVALDGAQPAVVECARLGAVVVHDEDGRRELPHDAAADVPLPELPAMRRLPHLQVDPQEGSVAGPLGGLEHLGRAIRDLAALLPGRSVVAADYETNDPQTPLGIAGRAGEALVVLIGDEEFALEP